ncbi:MAG: hypothetical protein JXR68_09465 [Bacteroidales bacterium]|nr:hypothetical protein [Bacteroidales bacterium]
MKKNRFIALALLSFLFVISSCTKKVDEYGLTKEINNIIPDEILTSMLDMGMPLNGGNEPPEIIGTYFVSPFILDSSNVPDDVSGKLFADFVVTFYDFNPRKLTVKIDYDNGIETGTGVGSFIVGEGNKFSVFCEIKATQLVLFKAEATMIFTGTLTDNGIEDFWYANFMVDNHGNEQGLWIENGEGRIIYDSDGFSERTDNAKAGVVYDDNYPSALSKK